VDMLPPLQCIILDIYKSILVKAAETAECECGLIESIPHFLFCCRKWERQRQKLWLQHGGRFGDLSYALGGYSSRQEGGESIDGPIER
jgi:hypothetical protein